MGAGILQDLVVVMVVAAAVTILFYRLKQPVVLGYLLAGALIGPHMLRFIHGVDSINGLAELGIIFLMFAVGLEFDLKKLRKVGVAAAIAAAVEVGIMLVIGYEVGLWLGWNQMDSIFLGAALSISSTTIIVKVLTEMGKLKEEYSELAFGILILEDIMAIVIVALLSSFGVTGSFEGGLIPSTIGAVLLFVFIFIAVGLVLVPRLIESVSKFHVEEILVITVVGLAFGAALLAHNLGFSVALGAFLMGAIIAESKAVRRVEHRIVPLRDLFTATFFVAVGMLVDPVMIKEHWWPILIITTATIVGKVVATTIAAFSVGTDGRTSLKTAFALGQIGEFSFIIAGLGLTLGVIRPELPAIAIAVCCITSLATPALIKAGPPLADKLAVKMPRWWIGLTGAYTRFAKRIMTKQGEHLPHHDHRRARHGTRMAIYAAWLFGLFIMAAFVSQWLGAEVGKTLSLSDNASRAAAVAFLGLAALPLFVAFVKATEAYVFAAAKASALDAKELIHGRARWREPIVLSRIIGGVASVFLVTAATLVAWGVHPLAVPNAWMLVPIVLAIVAIGGALWDRLERVYVGMERTLNELMGVDDHSLEEDRNKRLRERLPWGMDMEEIQIRPIDRAAWTSLKDLDLRDRTGATVLLVERGSHVIQNPHADIPILPHDKMILVGKRDQLDKAARYLATLSERGPVVAHEVRIPAGSPAIGRSVGEIDAPHTTGAAFGMIERKDGRLVAPSPRVLLEPDDHVTVYGPEASMQRVRERLHAKPSQRGKMGPAG
ncbi:MAG TPA: cation:proton antiporter [Candidatus Thermoplasmatota archaeon]|nr:cation:proton antiporter [Candidatus Thermoplasmatota archaeon]